MSGGGDILVKRVQGWGSSSYDSVEKNLWCRSFGSIVYYATGCLWLFRYPENVESAQYYGLLLD